MAEPTRSPPFHVTGSAVGPGGMPVPYWPQGWPQLVPIQAQAIPQNPRTFQTQHNRHYPAPCWQPYYAPVVVPPAGTGHDTTSSPSQPWPVVSPASRPYYGVPFLIPDPQYSGEQVIRPPFIDPLFPPQPGITHRPARLQNVETALHQFQTDPNEPIFVPELSGLPAPGCPFPCTLSNCDGWMIPTSKNVEEHLSTVHNIHKPQTCPWPKSACTERGQEIMMVDSVFRHIVDTHGWKYCWRCPWCGEDYPIGTRKDRARMMNRECRAKRAANPTAQGAALQVPVAPRDSQTNLEANHSAQVAAIQDDSTEAQRVIEDLKKLIEQRPELAPDLLNKCSNVFDRIGTA